jgi:HlyD family secretion protein
MPNPDDRAFRRRRLLWLGVGLLVLLAAFVTWRVLRRPPPLLFSTATADQGPVVARVTATGLLSALVTVQVGTQVSGRIAKLHTDYNATVKKGQLIAEIDPALFQANVEQAKANVLAAQGSLDQAIAKALDAKRQYDRDKPLRAQNLIAQADIDTAEANWKAADAAVVSMRGNLAQARAQLTQAQVNLEYTTIESPIDGTVISRSVDVGQTVAASLAAPTLFTIAGDLKAMQVDTSVAEADVGKLADKMEATFVVDAFPDERFKGTIRQIRNAPQTQQNVVTYDAVIDVTNPELKLRPGMTANVTVVYADRPDVVRVPNAALRFRPPPELLAQMRRAGSRAARIGEAQAQEQQQQAQQAIRQQVGRGARTPVTSGGGSGRTVWVLRGELPEPVQVTVGISDGTLTEITGGSLSSGDKVVTGVEVSGRPAASGPAAPGTPARRPF